ncbi:hypothetical protein LSH36_326g09049 [Paralvinella palmiformis]|uniref:Uncharacterized protein n=1 Tax=Paralvinella palmiformis TaxID=53620 RepID=A0AAD9JG38_9ANNE|nr:hypothetical protein LSH36_326g09049 [Paralvinella palmiformis]
MSAASATVPSTPVVSITSMGGGARGPPVSGPGSGTPGKCCENGRPITTDPLTGQTICSCQYNPGALLMAAGCYPRGMGVGVGVPGLAEAAGVYTSPYATAAIQGLLPAAPGSEHAAFYSSMGI